ncbi:alcohol dehydrogenase catalytic domain-containing protein [Chloroflexota bacterium]
MTTMSAEPNPATGASAMRASLLHGIRDLQLEELPCPRPDAGEVLLRVASVGVCGSDVHYYLSGRIGSQVVSAPIIMGHEFSAWVAGLGEGVEGLGVGQLVSVEPGISCRECEPCLNGHPNLCPHVRFCGTPPIDGVFAEYTVMPAENCFPLPDGITPGEGAMLEPLGIGIFAVDLAHLGPGYTVGVLGAGPIGLLIAAVARVSGASLVYMTEPLAHRRRFALEYAADAVFDPGSQDVVAEVQGLTGGRGLDVVFEAAGAAETPQQAADMVRIGGRVVVAGIPEDDSMTLNASTIRHKGLTIKIVRRMKHTYPRAIRLVETGAVDVKAIITHRFPVEEIADAFEMVASYRDGVLRAVIDMAT